MDCTLPGPVECRVYTTSWNCRSTVCLSLSHTTAAADVLQILSRIQFINTLAPPPPPPATTTAAAVNRWNLRAGGMRAVSRPHFSHFLSPPRSNEIPFLIPVFFFLRLPVAFHCRAQPIEERRRHRGLEFSYLLWGPRFNTPINRRRIPPLPPLHNKCALRKQCSNKRIQNTWNKKKHTHTRTVHRRHWIGSNYTRLARVNKTPYLLSAVFFYFYFFNSIQCCQLVKYV